MINMKHTLAILASIVAGLLFAAERPATWAVKMERAGLPNLHRVDAKLYRSAQPTAEGMTNLVALGVKTVINLRDNHSDADEIGGLPLAAKRIEIFTGKKQESDRYPWSADLWYK